MGLETVAVGAAGLSMYNSISGAQDQASATAREANLAIQNKAEQVRYSVGKSKVDFLSSGIAIEGGTTSAIALQNMYDTGESDIRAMKSNYENQIDSTIASGYQQAINTGLSTAMTMGAGSGAGGSDFGSMFAMGQQNTNTKG